MALIRPCLWVVGLRGVRPRICSIITCAEGPVFQLWVGRRWQTRRLVQKIIQVMIPAESKKLRPRVDPPPWLDSLLVTERRDLSGFMSVPAKLKMFREAYAGAANLTRSMRRRGVPTGRPIEAFPSLDNTGKGGAYVF